MTNVTKAERRKIRIANKRERRALRKKQILEDLEPEKIILEELGHKIERFIPPKGATDCLHHRVNGCLDFWAGTKTWIDQRTLKKGKYTDLVDFVTGYEFSSLDTHPKNSMSANGVPTVHW